VRRKQQVRRELRRRRGREGFWTSASFPHPQRRAAGAGRIAEKRDSINSVPPMDHRSVGASLAKCAAPPPVKPVVLRRGLDLDCAEIGARRLRRERERSFRRFNVGCAARLPAARARVAAAMRGRDLDIEQADCTLGRGISKPRRLIGMYGCQLNPHITSMYPRFEKNCIIFKGCLCRFLSKTN
jgi:hypothetical protein